MVVPIHEEESVEEAQFDAVALHEVPAEGTECYQLTRLATRTHCCLHPVVDLDLQVEELTVLSFRLGQLVEEVVQEEEVVEEVGKGDRGGGVGRGWGRG